MSTIVRNHRRLWQIAVTVVLLLCVGIAYVEFRWRETRFVVQGFISHPEREYSVEDCDTIARYLAGTPLSRPPWESISAGREQELIRSSLIHMDKTHDPYVFVFIISSWKLNHHFPQLPVMASDFLNRRDDAAAMVTSCTELPSVDMSLLSESRVRELLSRPCSERFQMALMINTSLSVFAKTISEFSAAQGRGELSPKAWSLFKRRAGDLGLLAPSSTRGIVNEGA